MIIQLNGKKIQLSEDVKSIQDLLNDYNLANRILVVEVNKEIIDKKEYGSFLLSDRDSFEIIHFVGGG